MGGRWHRSPAGRYDTGVTRPGRIHSYSLVWRICLCSYRVQIQIRMSPGSGCLQEPTAVHIQLIGLDTWTFHVHSGPNGRMFASTSSGSQKLLSAKLPAANAPTVLGALAALLLNAQARKGEKRSAGGNQQGHQKMPSFLYALMQDALTLGRVPASVATPGWLHGRGPA